MTASMPDASVPVLRDRLAAREATLASLRSRIKSARELSSKPNAQPTISDIQRRYLSAVAQLETKEKELPKAVFRSSSNAVSSLTTKWNKGIQGKRVERTRVDVHGDVDSAKKNFSAKDTARAKDKPKPSASSANPPQKKDIDRDPAQLFIEDDSEVPSWAKNQQKLVIKKENARSSVRDVDVRDLQGTVLENAARDGSEVERTKVNVGGNVKAALAMWGKTADEDAKALVRRKEEEKKRALAAEKARQEREDEKRIGAAETAAAKFADMRLSELTSEPDGEVELVAFLERKIALTEREIKAAEDELDKLEDSQ